jgi:hypothetical protein
MLINKAFKKNWLLKKDMIQHTRSFIQKMHQFISTINYMQLAAAIEKEILLRFFSGKDWIE